MKIKKGLLKQVEEDSSNTEELYSESTYRHIALLYNNAIYRYTKHQTKHGGFYSSRILEKKKEKQRNQIIKFIDICIEFETPFDITIDKQIKVLVEFYKKRGLRLFPSFATLISDNARKRMGYIRDNTKRRYTGSARVQELFKVQFLDIEKSLRDSMRKFYEQLCRIKKLLVGAKFPRTIALTELEIMARTKLISNIYVYSSPLSEETEFLKEVKKEAGQRLSSQQKEAVIKIKEDLMSEFKDKEILKYV